MHPFPRYANLGATAHASSFTGSPVYGGGGQQQYELGGPMPKRRRIDAGRHGGLQSPAAGAWDGHHQGQQQQTSEAAGETSYASGFDGPGVRRDYAGLTTLTTTTPTTAQHDVIRAESSDGLVEHPSTMQWHASPYPDVSSYQQPYFYQHTDPSIYTSPWPPVSVDDSGGGYDPSSGYSALIQPLGSMPFFPTSQPAQSQRDAVDDFDTGGGVAFHAYPDIDAGQHQYAYGIPPQQDDKAKAEIALMFEDASMHLKLQSLSILDNLATQLIHTIAKASFTQIQDMMRGNDTEESQAYVTLKSLFDQTRKVYSRETPFIDAIAIQMFQPTHQEIIRKANIATFISSIFGAHDVSFFHLNEFFMETFVPLGHRLLKWQGAIFLELKTQTYISALMNSDGNPEAMLDELFPADLDAQVLTRHPDAPSLSPSEQDFLDRSRARKSYLLATPSTTEDAMHELPKKYQWNDFIREFALGITRNVDGIMNVPIRAQSLFAGNHNSSSDKRATTTTTTTTQPLQPALLLQQHPPLQAPITAGAPLPQPLPTPQKPPRPSTASTSTTATRQPWSKAEASALLSGLAQVSGPHWSQILALYGRGGSASEVLKDRNQVQLKDKARNLKLWYLKMGREVPGPLRGVTGELRKRGGARARAALGVENKDRVGKEEEEGSAEEGAVGVGGNIDPELEGEEEGKKGKNKGGRKG